jgi:hypothetical protein
MSQFQAVAARSSSPHQSEVNICRRRKAIAGLAAVATSQGVQREVHSQRHDSNLWPNDCDYPQLSWAGESARASL